MSKFYTATEVQMIIGISKSMVQKYAKAIGVPKFEGRYVFSDSSIATLRRYMESRQKAHLETRLKNIKRPAAVPFNTPIQPSPRSAEHKPREMWRSNGTPQTAGDVSSALAGIAEARERAAAANRRERERVGGVQ